MKRAAFLGSLALLLQSAPVHAADELRVLAPVSDWTLDFADERCSLIREFADGDRKVRLQIDSYGPVLGYRVMISGDLVAGTEFRVAYSPDTRERDPLQMILGKFDGENAVSFGPAFLPVLPPADPKPLAAEQTPGSPREAVLPGTEFERSVTHMTVSFRLRKPFRLDTGSMAAPFAAMHRCVDDLIASWGIDPAQHRARTRPPVLVLDELPEGYKQVTVDLRDDRPGYTEREHQAIARALARERAWPVTRAGYVAPVRVMVDAAGKSTACVVQIPSASAESRQSLCQQFAGPYQPALDAEGRPMASFIQFGLN
jgi:hypothetical protein